MAAWTLFTISYRVAREVSPVVEGVATGGSATTIIDTVRLLDQFNDDEFNLGSAWILYDAAGAGASPEGKYGRITDFVKSSGTVTMTTVTDAVAAGDRYALANKRYNLDQIIQAINQALARIYVPTEDTTTLDTASAQLEYDLPAGVLDENIEVFIQGQTGDTNSNRWVRVHNWHIAETGVGVQKKLIFYSQPITVRDIKIRYYLPHTPLYAVTDKLREGVPLEQVVYNAALILLENDPNKMALSDKNMAIRLNTAREKAMAWTPGSTRQSHKLATWGIGTVYGDTENN